MLCRAYANLILAYEYTGLPNEAVAAALEGLTLLPEYGLELAVGAALACNATNMLRRRGRYTECEEVLGEQLAYWSEQLSGAAAHIERTAAGRRRQRGDRRVDGGLGERVGEREAAVGERRDRGAI